MKRIMFVSVILMLILLTASCITFPSNNGKPNDEINLNDYFGQEITISFWHAMGNSDYDILGKIIRNFKTEVKELYNINVTVDCLNMGNYD